MSRRVLITGAGRGIGRELALQSWARGDDVIVTLRDPSRVEGLPEGIRIESLEVTKPDQCAALADRLEGLPIDTLICNAGVFPARGGLFEASYTELEWFAGMMTNVAGPFFTARALVPNLEAGSAPRIAIMSSAMGSSADPAGGSYIYRASKAAATNLACNLSVELKPRGIAVGAYHPGWVRTDMGTGAAPVEVGNSAAGVLECINALSMESTGEFLDYLGRPLPF